jgi:hypothetical protein
VKSLIKVNPEHVKTRDQTMRVATAAVAGPALLYAGYKFPGSGLTRAALVGLGAALIYTNYATFREGFDTEEEDDLIDAEEDEDTLSGLLG